MDAEDSGLDRGAMGLRDKPRRLPLAGFGTEAEGGGESGVVSSAAAWAAGAAAGAARDGTNFGVGAAVAGLAACIIGRTDAREAGLRELVAFRTLSNPTLAIRGDNNPCAAFLTSALRSSRQAMMGPTQLERSTEPGIGCCAIQLVNQPKREFR